MPKLDPEMFKREIVASMRRLREANVPVNPVRGETFEKQLTEMLNLNRFGPAKGEVCKAINELAAQSNPMITATESRTTQTVYGSSHETERPAVMVTYSLTGPA